MPPGWIAKGVCGLSERPKILLIGALGELDDQLATLLRESYEVVEVDTPLDALTRLSSERFGGIYLSQAHLADAQEIGALLEHERILEGMSDGVVLIDGDNSILWGNGRLRDWTERNNVVGANFYDVLGSPEILGPDFCPFHTALATGESSETTLRVDENRYYKIHAAPVIDGEKNEQFIIVTLRDVTAEMQQQQKLAAIHQAGIELADLKPDEVASMTVEERIELLKSNILHYTQDLLNFDVVEVRLLDRETNRLEPLLAEGIKPEAASRTLHAEPQNNGVTGFVAATGKSYLCEDTAEDPLYIEGAKDARSSLTVPLMLHDEVIGTFNVEHPDSRAFSESDLQFLEIFSRDVAVALNQLELLAAEKASTAAESVDAIHSAVAMPVDVILNDAVNVMERYIGHEPDVVERLRRILQNARDIKQVIQKVGQTMAPALAQPATTKTEVRPVLVGRRVLVADDDESVRGAAHDLLERYGCIVETAHNGDEAIFMVRNLGPGVHYDVIIADIRLPDMSGYDLMLKLRQILDDVPLVLMTGFGYDPGHSIVKARREGLDAVLYKPFRIDQLLETVEKVIQAHSGVEQS